MNPAMRSRSASRHIVAALLAVAAVASPSSFAQAWPAKPVRLVVPLPPGGASDFVGRAIGQALSEQRNQPVVAENRGGAGATIGIEAVATSAPDGYTLLMGVNAGVVIAPHVHPKPGYDPLKYLVAIAGVAESPMLVVVPAVSPARAIGRAPRKPLETRRRNCLRITGRLHRKSQARLPPLGKSRQRHRRARRLNSIHLRNPIKELS